MRKFKKAVAIEIDVEAMQYDGSNGSAIRKWTNGVVFESPVLEPTKDNPTGAYIQSSQYGMGVGIVGTWVVKNVNGTFSLWANNVFEVTHKPIVD